MRVRQSFALLALAVLAVVAGFLVYFYSTKTSRAISYHRQQYLTLSQYYGENISAIITNEPKRSALVQAMIRERQALVKLGYLVERDFPMNRVTSKGDQLESESASFTDDRLWAVTIIDDTNGSRHVAHVIAVPNDILTWERIVAEFNAKTDR